MAVAQFAYAAPAMNMQISPLSLVSEVPLLTLLAVAGIFELFGWQYHSLSSAEDKNNFKMCIKEKKAYHATNQVKLTVQLCVSAMDFQC